MEEGDNAKIAYVCGMKMKLLLVLGLFSLLSCDNELDLVSDYKDIPVVYGILSLPQDEQFIRIEKAFIDPTTSALDIAQNPDSLYYENINVSILHEGSGTVYDLERVDGGDYDLPRDIGVFASDPNVLYKSEEGIFYPESGETYTLQIQRNNIDTLVTSTIVMINEPRIVRPSQTGTSSLNFDYVQPTTLKWNGGDNAGLYDLSFEIHYRERNLSDGGNFENKSFTWNIANNFEGEVYELLGLNFYGALASNLEVNENLERRFRFVDMILSLGGEEVKEYVRIGQANSGLTSSQDIPVFSNLSEGRGLFSSSQESRNNEIQVTVMTLDSIVNGQFTKDLNFEF